jgi:hypothetical protein
MTDDPWGEWYENYRRQRDGSADAEAALAEGLKRQVGYMAWFIVGWTAVVCGATLFTIWFLFW